MSDPQNNYNIPELLARLPIGDLTDTEMKILEDWRCESDANRQVYDKWKAEEFLRPAYSGYSNIDKRRARADMDRRIKSARPAAHKRRNRIVRYCAATIIPLAALAGVWLFTNNRTAGDALPIARITESVTLRLLDGTQLVLEQSAANSRIAGQDNLTITGEDGTVIHEIPDYSTAGQEMSYVTLDVPRGSVFDVALDDGTHVWLNAGSSLRFPTSFAGSQRHVFLEGEAYFSVTPDAGKPFIVETEDQTLRVIGTEFNIYAYSTEPVVSTLVTGSVSLKSKNSEAEALLTPGQQAELSRNADTFRIQPADIKKELAWRDMVFSFDGTTLEDAFVKLARWYDFSYSFGDADAAGLLLVGSIPAYDDITRIFNQIEALGQVTIERERNNVTITLKK